MISESSYRRNEGHSDELSLRFPESTLENVFIHNFQHTDTTGSLHFLRNERQRRSSRGISSDIDYRENLYNRENSNKDEDDEILVDHQQVTSGLTSDHRSYAYGVGLRNECGHKKGDFIWDRERKKETRRTSKQATNRQEYLAAGKRSNSDQ
ncbi:uncharacterized protein [Macrobrachium rosenbergii]|uniref:uncharacterized protein n=1 Tax=Macrobrachium rosenbergii TaxID=79674 RepID=UPI0034D62B5A